MIAKAEIEYDRYKQLYLKCSGLQQVHKALLESREDRDKAREELMSAEKALNEMRDREYAIANKISDDHAVADEKGVFVGRIFPQVSGNSIGFLWRVGRRGETLLAALSMFVPFITFTIRRCMKEIFWWS